MSTRRSRDLPVALHAARRQLDRWRSQHRPHTRLPEELWRKATALARQHGLNRTATALGLKYDSLKTRIEAPVVAPRLHKFRFCSCAERTQNSADENPSGQSLPKVGPAGSVDRPASYLVLGLREARTTFTPVTFWVPREVVISPVSFDSASFPSKRISKV